MITSAAASEPFELICVGFGPAAIALATAFEDEIRSGQLSAGLRNKILFLEKADKTAWQAGLLLPGTNINHNYYRDLATPRNPRSEFTFANYLHEHNRMFEHGEWSGAVSRIEWSQYVGWVAKKLSQYVRYGNEVFSIERRSDLLAVRTADEVILARQVVIACGMEPYIPGELSKLADKVFHASGYLFYRDALESEIRDKTTPATRICIVGGGLSAGEIALDLMSRNEPEALHITSVQRSLPFKNYNMSAFTSQIWMPEETLRFKRASESQRRTAFEQTFSTNFSGVDVEFSNLFWNYIYERKLSGVNNFDLLDRYSLTAASIVGGEVVVELSDNLSDEVLQTSFDVIIAATGYADTAPERLLSSFGQLIVREHDGKMGVAQNYRLQLSDPTVAPIWLNGHCEHTHGISDTQSFSLVAHKAELLLPEICAQFYAAAVA